MIADSETATKPSMDDLVTNELLDLAFDWLCRSRKNSGHNSDVWDLRFHWTEIKPQLIADLMSGNFQIGCTRLAEIDGEQIEIFSAIDALVLKAVSILLSRAWHHEISSRCFHVAGRGGGKGAIRQIQDQLPEHRFVFRSDVKGYYASIQHDLLMQQLREKIDDERLLQILEGYVRRTICDGGNYRDVECGIPLGCSLSPLIGALFLSSMDEEMEATGLFYARYMDDWVVLTKTRWHLRRAIRTVNAILDRLQLQQHPNKTFIGYISAGFDFLGYHFSRQRLRVAQQTFEQFSKKVDRLYEQTASPLCRDDAVVNYVQRWMRWVRSGVKSITCCFCGDVADDTLQDRQTQGLPVPLMMALER